MRDLHAEFLYRKIKSPNRFLAGSLRVVFRAISRARGVKYIYEPDYLKIKNKQVIFLCQHRSRNDYIYVYGGLRRSDIHVLCGYQNVFQRGIYTLFKKLGVIAKMLYQPDVHATKQLITAKKLGNSVMVFPEGIQSTSGSTHPINPATMKLLCKLKLPVVLVSLKGSYFTRTRYSYDVKKGKILVRYSVLFNSEDFENYTSDELYSKMLKEFQYNEFEEHKGEKIAFRGKKPNIYGLDNIIFKCPECKSEYKFTVEGDSMRCSDCGFEISMDEYYDIHAKKGELPFENIDQWYKWQRKEISRAVRDNNFEMSTRVKIGRINTQKLGPNYSLQYYGEGTLTLTNKGLVYKGTADGENVELSFSPTMVYSLTMSLQYDLDLYCDSIYYNFKLLENEKQVAKWMLAAEEIHNMYDTSWKEASEEVYG